jgi:hypothetical protein
MAAHLYWRWPPDADCQPTPPVQRDWPGPQCHEQALLLGLVAALLAALVVLKHWVQRLHGDVDSLSCV